MRRAAGIAGVLLLLAGAFALGLLLTLARDDGPASLPPGSRDRAPEVVDEVRRQLAESFYRPVPATALKQPTIDRILASLDDPYTDYLTPEEYDLLKARTARSYSGVGLTVGRARGGLVVKAALQGPARQAGIRPGDLIVSIDGRRVRALPFQRSLELIKGKAGTVVRLMVRRPREGTLSFAVKRREIELPPLRARTIDAGRVEIAYVRLLSFRANAGERLEQRAKALVKAGADGILLDLRDNSGGLLAQAVRSVSLFVDKGVVCVTEGRRHGRHVYDVTGKAQLPRIPLVVLVDRDSASAAEIVAAALGDHDRAVVVGEPTYGKAFVQSVRPLSNGAALKLTTAVFLTPSGRNLTGRGLAPDVRSIDNRRTPADDALLAAQSLLLKQIRS
ncbi:MAG: S41 family peptidase [Actinobacteria bacterium]|nr:S41 family peptidase [Actinomycetota bacterium]